MTKKEFLLTLLALTIINVYCGFFARQSINPDGCNFMQVMYMYFIGRYLALHCSFKDAKLRKWSGALCFIGVALYATTWIINDEYLQIVKSLTFFNNNNPWSIFNSIVIFLFFTTLHFHSKSVNWLAKGVFAIYLLHTSIWISTYWNQSFISIYDNYSPGTAWLIISAIFITFSVLVMCFDHIRALITNCFANRIDNYVNRHYLHI